MTTEMDKHVDMHETILEIHNLIQEGKLSMSDISDRLRENVERSKEVISSSIIEKHKAEIIKIGDSLPDGFKMVIKDNMTAEVKPSCASDSDKKSEEAVKVSKDESVSPEVSDKSTGNRGVETAYPERNITEMKDLKTKHVHLFSVIKEFKQNDKVVPKMQQLSNITDIPMGTVGKYISDLVRVGLIKKPKGMPNSYIEITEMGEEVEFDEEAF